MERVRYDLTDEVCIETEAPALFSFTFRGETAFVVNKASHPGDIRDLRRSSVELFVMAEFENIGDGIYRCVSVGDRGTTFVTHYDAANVIRNIALVENEMEVKRIECQSGQLMAFGLWFANILAGLAIVVGGGNTPFLI